VIKMIMPAVIGTIAQEGQSGGGGGGSSAPTGVSIATSSSGNYDNAVVVDAQTGITFFDDDGSNFAGDNLGLTFQINQMSGAYTNNAVQETFVFKGYCRATGATSFQWDVSIDTSNTSVNGSHQIVGTASTSQDATGTNGAGEKVEWTFAGGKGGVQYPENGMALVMKVNCTATNAHGSTAADELSIEYIFE
jgi:hypothetical protein